MGDLPIRVKTISKVFTPATQSHVLFTPGIYQFTHGGYSETLKYDGEILSLRMNAVIHSLPYLIVPDTSDIVSQQEIDLIIENIKGWSKIGFGLYYRSPTANPDGSQDDLIGMISIYPTQPIFQASLSEFLSDLTKHPIEHNWSLVGKIINFGYGVLKGGNTNATGVPLPDDYVVIHGAAQEVGGFLTNIDCNPMSTLS